MTQVALGLAVFDGGSTGAGGPPPADPYDVRRALRASGLLREFNEAGVLAAADVHVATRLGMLGGEDEESVLLAAALAVRAPRIGHVCTDLAEARHTVTADAETPVDLLALPWPDDDDWRAQVAASPMVAVGADGPAHHPLRLVASRLYLDRYWREEQQVAIDLRRRSEQPAAGVDPAELEAGLDRLFADELRGGSSVPDGLDPKPSPTGAEPDLQRLAAATAVLRRASVIAGGPGTGKTTTVARVLALLAEQSRATGEPPPRVALAAPTGKAAARLEEAVQSEAATLPVDASTRDWLRGLEGSTLHRLLGWRPGNRNRFRHDGTNRLPHDVVVVDETSMVSLSLMAKLIEAVGRRARLILVGDPEQLASVEAGAVLGDIVGPAAGGLRMRPAARSALAQVSGEVDAVAEPGTAAVGDGVVVLRRVHRYGGGIASLAQAVQRGDAGEVLRLLRDAPDGIAWIEVDLAAPEALEALAPVRSAVVDAARQVSEAAHAGDARSALAGLADVQLLCAHRRGPYGASVWRAEVERWLASAIDGYGSGERWYVGQPLLVTQNDHALRLYNGDIGVVVERDGRPTAVFERRGEPLEVSPTRLAAVETVHAMTVHKSQGSQFAEVAVLLPDPTSRILTRELLYTAVTRARRRVTVVGTEAAVRTAVENPIARASGLRDLLWS